MRNNVVLGYIAPILNLKNVLEDVYEGIDSSEFALHFSTKEGIDFDRQAYYDGSPIFNEINDSESYRSFNANLEAYQYQSTRLYGQEFKIGIAYKKPFSSEVFIFNILISWYISLAIFLAFGLRQSYSFKRLNLQYQEANDMLVQQKEQMRIQNEELERNIDFINSISKISPVHVYVFDLVKRVNVFENRNIAEYLGYDKSVHISFEELYGKHFHSEDKKSLDYRTKKYETLKDDEGLESAVRFFDSKKELKWFLGKEVVFKRNSDGYPEQMMGVLQDITLLKSIEIELSDSEKRLKNAQVVSKVGHWEIDNRTGRAIVSEEFYHIIGVMSDAERKVLIKEGNVFQDYIHYEDIEFFKKRYLEALETGEKYSIDYRILNYNGEEKYVHSIVNITKMKMVSQQGLGVHYKIFQKEKKMKNYLSNNMVSWNELILSWIGSFM